MLTESRTRFIAPRVLLAGMALLLAACSGAMRSEQVPGSFAWFDLVTEAPETAEKFYGQLFGWSFAKGPVENSKTISGNGEFIGGLVSVSGDENRAESQWQPVLSVTNTMDTLATVKSSGGRLSEQPVQTSNGTFAAILDPSRAPVTLYDGTAGIVLGGSARLNTWVWVDLLTNDTTRAKRFYRSVAGMETRKTGANTVFVSGDAIRGGLVYLRRSQVEPNWLPFVLVGDLGATIAKAEGLGAGVLIKDDYSAILLDPTGAAIGVTTREGAGQ